jgi:dolichol-phosphate mannosyltransferase
VPTTNTTAVRPPGVFVNLPVLNESENIAGLLDAIGCELQGREYTICVIDDGSRDGTTEIVEAKAAVSGGRIQLVRRQKTARGCQRGAALLHGLRWGLENTPHEVFVEIDGDFSHRPEELQTGIAMIVSGVRDVVIASKYLAGSRTTNRPLGRRLVSAICNVGVRTFVSRVVSDYSNGYRFYSRAAGEIVAGYEIRHGSPIYLTEAMAIWLTHCQRIGEFPTVYIGRNEGLSKVQWVDLLKGAVAVFDVAMRFHVTGFTRRRPSPAAADARDLPVMTESAASKVSR